MLVRFHDPWSSRVTIDGHDLRHVTQASLRARMGVVLQDGFVFRSTIRENIRMGRPTATEEAIADAARDAGMTQRLALARAILRKPAIVLLDEISSALDPAEDLAVNRTLDELSKTTTLISATHRLASVTGASHIFVFDKGRLVEQGSHFELMGMHGTYASLWHKQAGFRLSQIEFSRRAGVVSSLNQIRRLLLNFHIFHGVFQPLFESSQLHIVGGDF